MLAAISFRDLQPILSRFGPRNLPPLSPYARGHFFSKSAIFEGEIKSPSLMKLRHPLAVINPSSRSRGKLLEQSPRVHGLQPLPIQPALFGINSFQTQTLLALRQKAHFSAFRPHHPQHLENHDQLYQTRLYNTSYFSGLAQLGIKGLLDAIGSVLCIGALLFYFYYCFYASPYLSDMIKFTQANAERLIGLTNQRKTSQAGRDM